MRCVVSIFFVFTQSSHRTHRVRITRMLNVFRDIYTAGAKRTSHSIHAIHNEPILEFVNTIHTAANISLCPWSRQRYPTGVYRLGSHDSDYS